MIKLEDYSEIMNKCAHCNYCQATCPVYLEDMLESHVARNRLNIINQAMLEKSMPLSDQVREIIDRCLLCTNCVQTCPCHIPIDEIIIAARHEMPHKGGLTTVKQYVMNQLLSQRGLTGALSKAGSLVQKIGLTKNLPTLAPQPFDKMYSGVISPKGKARGRVAYFVGCGTNYLYPDTGIATVKVLVHNDIEVVIPDNQVCCGIPSLAEGDLETCMEMVRTNVRLFSNLEVDAIITDCTSCGMMFKEKYNKLLPADDPLAEQVQAFSSKVWEVTDYLNHLGLSQQPGRLEKTYTYHVPCHRGWSPTVKDAPRHLLSQIPGSKLIELEEPEKCCGAAGTFFMEYRELSESIRSHRIEDIENIGVSTVITQCPVCRFYIAAGLDKNKEVTHPIILLSQSYEL